MEHTTSIPSKASYSLLLALILITLSFVAHPASAYANGATAYEKGNGRTHQPHHYDWSGDAITPAEYDWSDD